MVKRGNSSFLRDETGVSLTEGLLVIPIVMIMFGAFVEFGYAMVQLNQTVKAMQYGARKLAVSDSVNDAFIVKGATSVVAGNGTNSGQTVPTTAGGPWTCTGNACNSELNRIVYGSTTATSCGPIGGTIKPAMCHINPRIEKKDVTVTYTLTGLGYYGRPWGAVVTIKISVNLPFNFPVLGTLLGLNQITIPATPVTITSEDLSDTS